MFVDPARERRGRDGVAVARFQFRGRLGQRVAEIVEGDAVEDDGERIGLVAQRRRRRGEYARAGGAAPELHRLKFLGARALADQLDAAAMRTALGPLGGVGNTGGGRRRACGCGERIDRAGRRARGLGAGGIGPLYNVDTIVMSRMPEGRACHGYWKGGVSRIPRDGGRKRLAGQRVDGFGPTTLPSIAA